MWKPISLTLIAVSLLASTNGYTIYGGSPKTYSLATHATTNSFLFTNRNLPSFNFPFFKGSHQTLPTVSPYFTKDVFGPNAISQTVPEESLNFPPSSIEPFPNDLVPLEETIPKLLDTLKSSDKNGFETVKSLTKSTESETPKRPSDDAFGRPPTIQRVTYSIPVDQPLISHVAIPQTSSGVTAISADIFGRDSSTEVENSKERTPIEKTTTLISDPEHPIVDVKEDIIIVPQTPNASNSETTVSQPLPSTIEEKMEPESLPGTTPVNIQNRQDYRPVSNLEQPLPFFPSQQQQQAQQQTFPNSFLNSGNNRFAIPNLQMQSQQPPPSPQTPPTFPSLLPNANRFFVPRPNHQQTNQQFPPPPPPPSYFHGPGGPEAAEPENGYNPFHLHERYPEPPYESEFTNEPTLPIEQRERSGESNPPLSLNFAQGTLRQVTTEELLEVVGRKQITPDCAFNTISYGPNGEDCIQARKR